MSITESPIPVPAKKKPKKRKAAKPRAAAAPKPADEFAGLTVADCCKACRPEGCIISGSTFCGHPRKGGLQGGDIQNAASLERYRRAQKRMAQTDADRRFS